MFELMKMKEISCKNVYLSIYIYLIICVYLLYIFLHIFKFNNKYIVYL